MPLDLVVPDLLPAADAPAAMRELRLPWVERWLVRAERQRIPLRGLNAWLARAFSLPDPPPVAAVTLAADDKPAPGTWLRADPVHFRIAGDALTLHDAAALDVTAEEAGQLIAALRSHFAADGIELYAPVPDRWYARVPEGEVPRTTALEDAVGRNVFGLLPRGSGRINWGAAITEAQMVLAAQPANSEREAAGKPPINSVWFWGEGAAPARVASPYALAYASDPFAIGLARLAGIRALPPAASLDRVDAVRPEEWVLAVDDRLTAAVRVGDEGRWIEAARALDESWFARLAEAAERFDGMRLVLPGPRDTLVATISPRARWRWFRKRKALATHA
ncbi:MAG TPA: hypothetical protein VFD95_07445 [Usitatibacter sp.]|nr:hypothetical protein [Usitatibacter sp.]